MVFAVNENLSKRINSLRFLLIVFVVIIHSSISAEYFAQRNIETVIPVYLENVQKFLGIITAIAVPLFFLFSAYFLYFKEQKYIFIMKKKCRTILLPYFLWHILIIGFYIVVSTIPLTKIFYTPEKPILSWGFFDWMKAFFGDYSIKNNLINSPFVYQFWFLRDLFILNIFFIGIKKLVDKFPLGTFVLFFILWTNNIKIYFVSPEALIFFSLGYYIVKYNIGIENIDHIKIIDLSVIYGITIIMEYFLLNSMSMLHKLNIIIGCIFFLKISQYFLDNIKLYQILTQLEKYQFIVYAIHGIIISQLIKIYVRIIPLKGAFIVLFSYFLMILFTVIISLIFGILFKNLLPKTYGIFIGGR